MTITFTDDTSNMEFEYFDQPPPNKAVSCGANLTTLGLYALYRNSLYKSYKEKEQNLPEDIKKRKKEYLDENKPRDSVYHYSIAVALGTMKEWQQSAGKMKCFIAFRNDGNTRSKVGFVHFIEQTVNGKRVIYIAEAAVKDMGQGIGRRLMECVLAHYPSDTEFYVLTRVFNSEAKTLYEQRLKFTSIGIEEIKQLGYDDRYCGFKHTSNEQEIFEIKNKQIISEAKELRYSR